MSAVIFELTGLPVFCWITIDRERMAGPATSVPILISYQIAASSLLSIARSKRARSLILPSRSRKNRIDQICRIFNARLAPTCLPAFQAGLTCSSGVILRDTHYISPSAKRPRKNDCGQLRAQVPTPFQS